MQADARVRERETTLESARRANDLLSGSLKAAQDEAERLRAALGELKDTAAHWQDHALGVNKELEMLQRKVSCTVHLVYASAGAASQPSSILSIYQQSTPPRSMQYYVAYGRLPHTIS